MCIGGPHRGLPYAHRSGAPVKKKKNKFWPKVVNFINKVCGWCWGPEIKIKSKSLVLSSNFVGISFNWPSVLVLGSTSSSTKKISFSLAFNAAHVSKLIGLLY